MKFIAKTNDFSKAIISLVLIAAMVLSFAACKNEEKTSSDAGSTLTFNLVVVDDKGNETKTEIETTKTTVGDALLEKNIIEGEESEYGLYIKSVNGIVADYEKTKTYWAFYVDGEYATTGVDQTKIIDGATYSLKVEK